MPRHKPHGVSLLVLRLPARPHFRLLPTTQDYQLGQGHGGRHLSTVRNVLPGHREETCLGAWLLCSTHLPQRSKTPLPPLLAFSPCSFQSWTRQNHLFPRVPAQPCTQVRSRSIRLNNLLGFPAVIFLSARVHTCTCTHTHMVILT